MHPVLRLYEDVLSSAENVEFRLPPLPRFIFVVHGGATIGGTPVKAGEAWQGEDAITVNPYDVVGTADALSQALAMPVEERAERTKRLAAAATALPPAQWFLDQLHALDPHSS